MTLQSIPEIRAKLYTDFLRSLSLWDVSLQEVSHDITLASLVNAVPDDKIVSPNEGGADSLGNTFRESELLIYGAPARYYLNPSSRQQLLAEVQFTLSTLADIFYGDVGSSDYLMDTERRNSLPEVIQTFKRGIESLHNEARTIACRLTDKANSLKENHSDLSRELEHAVVMTFPADNDARSADIDLLAATIESSLIKLSLTNARSERAIYHHRPSPESRNIAQALSVASSELQKEEAKMINDSNVLDHQLHEYETMLQLVDGGSGGYQQIINDWTKVKQETEECLRDLRRLGWTGD
ncbi:hypothetical protein CPB84DRAFT_1511056 [Gymnopilus junonius]|uniref:Uncharacterized protein n=1 Tax=Gymnopilus junonius TaxID=109634 RepID=A0A9P5NWR7_GYMJU|nr:hypothetical protein CPB84DRAFT_1511056 [Gymnopilus junonius]